MSNIPLASLNDFAKANMNKHTRKNLGDSRDLFCDFGSFVQQHQFDAIIMFLDQQCFPKFGFTFDGSPTFTSAEASENKCLHEGLQAAQYPGTCCLLQGFLNWRRTEKSVVIRSAKEV